MADKRSQRSGADDLPNDGQTTAHRALPSIPVVQTQTDAAPSAYSHFIPIVPAPRRPHTGRSNRTRPGTAQTRFSIEAARSNQRRMVSENLAGRPGTRQEEERNGLQMLQEHFHHRQQRSDRAGDGVFEGAQRQRQDGGEQAHTHTRPSCRQCFRAGFDCAVQLHKGHGTGARKALQEFVAAGGLDALSGAEDFYEGSVWGASQAGDGEHVGERAQMPVTGQNFVDKLSEIAFGESALSRPVTRGAVQDMLEERSKTLTERQKAKTVDEFLAELQELQKRQEEEMALKETEEEYERSQTLSKQRTKSGAPTPVPHKEPDPPSPGSGETMLSPQHGDHRSQSLLPQDARNDAYIEDVEEPAADTTDVQSRRSSDAVDEDELPFLADRWTVLQKVQQLTFCTLWIFCVQCVGSGYSIILPAIVEDLASSDRIALQAGGLTFLVGEAGGMILGAALSCYGRHRVRPISAILFSAVCVVSGFMRQPEVLISLRGVLGSLAGLFEIAVVGTILDMATSRRQKFFLLSYTVAWILAAQAAGPWIAKVTIDIGSWPWTYWMAAIFGLLFTFLSAFLSSETEPTSIYRNTVYRLRMHNDNVWTPEPNPVPPIAHLIRFRLIRPLLMLFQHGLVSIGAVLMALCLGASVAILSPLAMILGQTNRLSEWQVCLLITICIVVGLCVGITANFLSAVGAMAKSGEMGKAATRSRILFMDEKGIIDAQRPQFDPERILHMVMVGLLACVVGLYTLALTAARTSWIFAAISLTLIITGTTILATGLVQYLSESYYPATLTKSNEILSLSAHAGPAPKRGEASLEADRNSAGEDQRFEEKDEDDYTLMSGVDEDGKRWDANWALSALSVVISAGLISAGAMTVVGQIAVTYISFTLFAAIVATVVLILAGLAFLLLYRLGREMRRSSFDHIAKTEQRIWRKKVLVGESEAGASAATSTGITRSERLQERNSQERDSNAARQGPRPILRKIRPFLLPKLVQQSREASEEPRRTPNERDHAGSWLKGIVWPRRKVSTVAGQQGPAAAALNISAPFDIHHVASGDQFPSFVPATPLHERRRRSTLVEMPELADELFKRQQDFNAVAATATSPKDSAVGGAVRRIEGDELPPWAAGRPSLRRVDRRSLRESIDRDRQSPVVDKGQTNEIPFVRITKPEQSLEGTAAARMERFFQPVGYGRSSMQSTSERPSVQMAERRTNELFDPQFADSYQRQLTPLPRAAFSPVSYDNPLTSSIRRIEPEGDRRAKPQQRQSSMQAPSSQQHYAPVPSASALIDGHQAATEAQKVWLSRVRQPSMGGIDLSPASRAV